MWRLKEGNALTVFPFENFRNGLHFRMVLQTEIPFFYLQICSNIYIFFICNKFNEEFLDEKRNLMIKERECFSCFSFFRNFRNSLRDLFFLSSDILRMFFFFFN